MSEEKSEFPDGWVMTKFTQLIAADGLFSDGDWVESKDQDPNGSIRLLQLADVGDGRFIDKSSRFVNQEKFEKLRCTEVLENDVLIARMPDPLGRACLVPKLKQKSITVVDVAIVRPGMKSVSPAWLMHCINSPEIRQHMELESTGSTRKRIARGKIAEIKIPVPPLAEQNRIADKLEAVLGRVDACRAHLDRVPALLKRFRQSVLAAATSGKLTEEWRGERSINRNWGEETVGSIVTRVEAGLNVRCDERPPLSHEKGLVKISAVTWGVYDDNESKTLLPGANFSEHTRIKVGDFLISRANTIELVGACVIVHETTRPVYLSDKVLRLVMPDELKKWLLIVLQSPSGRKQIEDLATGNQLSMRNLAQANMRQIRVPFPTPLERTEIVRRVEALFTLADRIEARLATAQKTVERLTPATLAKAFRGELVPQDPNDEPASALLERLKSGVLERPAKKTRQKRTPKA